MLLQALQYAIERSCINKAEVVAADEREGGVRATLNLGHTFGHAMETWQGYGELLGHLVCLLFCLYQHGHCHSYCKPGLTLRCICASNQIWAILLESSEASQFCINRLLAARDQVIRAGLNAAPFR